ncbi:hypothetical protein E5288_WYG010780 [Bos mutus]|uniref:Uncharacterized protein n=1 Tax=Bos mutus TaxID=72004 RepID=A0A6B0RYJ8_9CETA|nr:hypothetical protein [Bos mutus]
MWRIALGIGFVRLQTGMCGAFGKPLGTVIRVLIGQGIMPICNKLKNKEHVIEALHRAKFKFSGCGKIHISKNWRFTECSEDEFGSMVAEEQFIPGGYRVKHSSNCSSQKNVRTADFEVVKCAVPQRVLGSVYFFQLVFMLPGYHSCKACSYYSLSSSKISVSKIGQQPWVENLGAMKAGSSCGDKLDAKVTFLEAIKS